MFHRTEPGDYKAFVIHLCDCPKRLIRWWTAFYSQIGGVSKDAMFLADCLLAHFPAALPARKLFWMSPDRPPQQELQQHHAVTLHRSLDRLERPRTRHSDDGSGCEEHTASAYLAVLVSWFDDSALLLHRTRSHFSKQQCWDEELKKQCHAMTIWLLSDEKDRLEQTINLLRKESLLLLFYLATHFAVHRD